MGDVKTEAEVTPSVSNEGTPEVADAEEAERSSSNEDVGTTDAATPEVDASETGGEGAPAGKDVEAEVAESAAEVQRREMQSRLDRLEADNQRLVAIAKPHLEAEAKRREEEANSLEAFQARAAEVGEIQALREMSQRETRQILADELAARDNAAKHDEYVRDAVATLKQEFKGAGKSVADFDKWYAERSWNSKEAALRDAKLYLSAEKAQQALKTAEENALRSADKHARTVQQDQTPRGSSAPAIGEGSMTSDEMERLAAASKKIGSGRGLL